MNHEIFHSIREQPEFISLKRFIIPRSKSLLLSRWKYVVDGKRSHKKIYFQNQLLTFILLGLKKNIPPYLNPLFIISGVQTSKFEITLKTNRENTFFKVSSIFLRSEPKLKRLKLAQIAFYHLI